MELFSFPIEKMDEVYEVKENGIVVSVADGIIQLTGLSKLKSGELVLVGPNKVTAMILNLESKVSKGILFGTDNLVSEGDFVVQTNSLVSVGVNTSLLGRVVDALGNPIDGKGALPVTEFFPVDVKAPGIISRKSVH